MSKACHATLATHDTCQAVLARKHPRSRRAAMTAPGCRSANRAHGPYRFEDAALVSFTQTWANSPHYHGPIHGRDDGKLRPACPLRHGLRPFRFAGSSTAMFPGFPKLDPFGGRRDVAEAHPGTGRLQTGLRPKLNGMPAAASYPNRAYHHDTRWKNHAA
ncbi:hypothetical protein BDP55DRAFT_636966 [Colletotrichum godetiae]|uniref:Uncharacterized protein n=1 Tax=Colletotrichum godetiae TaxID=1209918 RepID=A0AAJ0AEH8_9PEZI|nr:uncharacterized protein BDP55DRAFT_636966 [Colletotrichum godetiae]KAK1659500.1 hypothetical protein BDP55DRAFT_636966 [Colletotrichum godetiae]